MNLSYKQALKTSYTKELAITSLRQSNGVSKIFILPHRGVNQSQYECQFNHQKNTKGQETNNFPPEVHVLAGTLVPIMSINT
jgi:hypothetical protein